MNLALEQLIVLQTQDLELLRLRGELADLPKRLRAVEEAQVKAQTAMASGQQRLAAEEKLRRNHESEIAALRTRQQRLRKSLDAATNAQQVAAFEHDLAFAESAIQKLEDEEFASLERTEALEAEQTLKTQAVSMALSTLADERKRAASLQARHAPAISGLEQERDLLRTQIAVNSLSVYDRLTKTRGTAIAEAIGTAISGKCGSCQMGLRPQRWQDLIGREHLEEIFHCETCGRLLFWDPRHDNPQPWPAGDRLRAAQAVKLPATPGSGGSQ